MVILTKRCRKRHITQEKRIEIYAFLKQLVTGGNTLMYQDVPNIKEKCEIINERGRLGDFEGDTVVSGKKYRGGLVSLADRKSRYYLIKKVGNLKTNTINMTINALLKGEKVESITFDNGVEFSSIIDLPHQCYRADAYAS